MRCKVLVLTHGNLAEAFVHAVSLIYGEVPQLAFKNMPEQWTSASIVKSWKRVSAKMRPQAFWLSQICWEEPRSFPVCRSSRITGIKWKL